MVSGVASYGGVSDVPVVGQRYCTEFLISVPGDPRGPGSSAIETELVLPPNTSIDTTAPIRRFGQPRGASTFTELTGSNWSFDGSSGPYGPSHASPSALHTGGLSFVFRPMATGQLFDIFVPVTSSHPLVGAASPADGSPADRRHGCVRESGLEHGAANVFASSNGSARLVYFTRPAATPFW